jgi:hypothetical protein
MTGLVITAAQLVRGRADAHRIYPLCILIDAEGARGGRYEFSVAVSLRGAIAGALQTVPYHRWFAVDDMPAPVTEAARRAIADHYRS